jgi:multiple antibiotic resistance protein
MDTAFAVKFFGALLAIMNPLSGLPIFLSMTEGMGEAAQRRISLQVALCIAVLGTVTALAGARVLAFFGIGVPDLQVAGGLVVLKLAFGMLGGGDGSMHHGTEGERAGYADAASIAFYPLAFPLMLGPGTIATLILFAGQADGPADWAGYFAAFGAVVLAVAVVFALGSRFGRFLSGGARAVMTRVMGLILAAIAVQMVAEGAKALLPGLAGPS